MSYVLSAVALTTLGVGLNYYANKQAANRQDSALAASLRNQGQLQQQAAQDTQNLVQKIGASNSDASKSSLLASFTNELNNSRGRAIAPLSQAGAVSQAYTKAANDAASGVTDFGNNTANLLSSIDAPALQRQGEAADLSRYGAAVSGLKRQSAADEFLTQMRLRSITPNPWLTGLGNVMTGAGQAMGMGGFGGGGAGAGAANGGGKVVFSGGYGTNLPFN